MPLTHRVSSWLRAMGAVAMLGPSVPHVLPAQHVRAEVVRARTAEPFVGAIVSLEQEAGGPRLSPVLTDARGRATLAAPTAGRYRLRVDYVGIRTWRSPALSLTAGDTLDYRAEVPQERTTLPAVVVSGSSACVSRPAEDATVSTVWDEARKAVLASTLVERARAPTLRIRRFNRLFDARGQLRREESDTVVATTVRPFATLRSAAGLSRDGYVLRASDGDLYLAPDATVLLSEEFAADHCFAIAQDRRDDGLVGLAFEPNRSRRDIPEIAGTFWLDRETRELRHLEFRYVNVDRLTERARAGGRVEFRRLDTGHWIVSSWHVRTPRLGVVRSGWVRGGSAERDTLIGAREEGAAVTAVVPRVVAAGPATISGMVHDSLRGQPLAGVRVRALGADATALTDAMGRYRLSLSSGGTFTVELAHPRLALYRIPSRHDLTVDGGEARVLDVAIPGTRHLAAMLCPAAGAAAPRRAGHLVGQVTAAANGAPIPYAAVRASWAGVPARGTSAAVAPGSVAAQGDSAGTILLCHLPAELRVEVVVEAPGYSPWTEHVRLAAGGIREQEIRMDGCTAVVDDADCGAARTPVIAADTPPEPARLTGTVTDAAGAAIPGAEVEIVGTSLRAVADREGRFDFDSVPPGPQVLRARRLGHLPRLATVVWPRDAGVELTFVLAESVNVLDAVVVEGELAKPARYAATARFDEFYRRRSLGIGRFVTRDEIERMAGASDMGDLLRATPGIRTIRQPGGGLEITFPRCGVAATDPSAAGGRGPEAGRVALFVDGVQTGMDMLANLGVADIEAVEIFRSGSELPVEARGNACAAIFLWTRFSPTTGDR